MKYHKLASFGPNSILECLYFLPEGRPGKGLLYRHLYISSVRCHSYNCPGLGVSPGLPLATYVILVAHSLVYQVD